MASELGVGSTFTVTIPRGSGHLPPDQILVPRSRVSSALRPGVFTEEASRWQDISCERREEPAIAFPETASTSLKPFRILLAEDNRDMRDYITRVIGGDYDIKSVSNGEEALSAVKAYCPDMLISDVMMPRMDGFALVKALRSVLTPRGYPLFCCLRSIEGDQTIQVYGIAGQIRQVIAHLVSNALDAVPVGGKVWMRAEQLLNEVEILVGDAGSGMSKTEQSALFRPFNSTKGDYGNGLGLYISLEIAERHHGRFMVESVLGKGTIMRLRLPAVAE